MSHADDIENYMLSLPDLPLLTKEEERDLALRAREGDEGARDRLILSNLRFVVSCAKKYARRKNNTADFTDLISHGIAGLIIAADKFDPDVARFTTYSSWWIRRCITRGQEHWRTIRLPAHVYVAISSISGVREHLKRKLGEDPTYAQIAEKLKIDVEKVAAWDTASNRTSVSRALLDFEGDFFDTLEAPTIDDVEEEFFRSEEIASIQSALRKLDPRMRVVVMFRHAIGVDKVYTLAQVGKLLDLSRERVRQLANDALDRLEDLIKVVG